MTIRPAEHGDEPRLRELLGGSAMPGWVRLAFGREPDFFHAVGVQGKTNQVMIAEAGGRVVGMGCRSVKPLWVNGERMDFGYLGGLRLHPGARGGTWLARGYAALRRLHEADPAPAYLTTIVEENSHARRLLASGRAGLPHYLDRGRYITHAICLQGGGAPRPGAGVEIRRGDEIGLEPILGFLREFGRRRQFFPVLEAGDFGGAYLRGLGVGDFCVALKAGKILGVAAAWDQRAFKQVIVRGYAPPIRFARPVLSALLRFAGFRGLPAAGRSLNSVYVAFACVRDDDPGVMRALLGRIRAEHRDGDNRFLLYGLHERDPLAAAVRDFRAFRYVSRLYLVCWDDGLNFVNGLDPARIPHLEPASL